MTKIEATTATLKIEQKAREEIAFCRGQIARCHRNTIAHLMPKFESAEEVAAYERGFQDVANRLAE